MNAHTPNLDLGGGKRALSALPGAIMEAFYNHDGTWRAVTPFGLPVFYRALYGGRGSAKSESIARILLGIARSEKGRALCTREHQNSIEDSVYKTIEDAAEDMGIHAEFRWLKTSIVHKRTRYTFIFRGLQKLSSIKSMKGLTHCWVEEAQTIPKETWQVLEPTMRTAKAEIWASYNPDQEDDATHVMFVVRPRPDAIVAKVNWRDNPFFPEILERQRVLCQVVDPDAYEWIWEGQPRKLSHAVIFRDRLNLVGFVPLSEEEILRQGGRIHLGMDFGFADDPSVLVRCYTLPDPGDPHHRQNLYITHARFGYHIELDDLGAMMEEVEDAKRWPIKGDGSRPETISKLAGEGFPISAAEKWPGSVDDGIAHLRAFKTIYVQAGLTELQKEFRLYSYKTDPRQVDEKGQPIVLPVVIDRWNHGIDALRYSLDGYIQRGGIGVWAMLAAQQ